MCALRSILHEHHELLERLPNINMSLQPRSQAEEDRFPGPWKLQYLEKPIPGSDPSSYDQYDWRSPARAGSQTTLPRSIQPTRAYSESTASIPRPPKASPGLPTTPKDTLPSTHPASRASSTATTTTRSNSSTNSPAIATFSGAYVAPSQWASGPEPTERNDGAKGRKLSFAQRWKLMLKELFTSHSIDESEFERMGDYHWTDDS